jgi:hypothetical protein
MMREEGGQRLGFPLVEAASHGRLDRLRIGKSQPASDYATRLPAFLLARKSRLSQLKQMAA